MSDQTQGWKGRVCEMFFCLYHFQFPVRVLQDSNKSFIIALIFSTSQLLFFTAIYCIFAKSSCISRIFCVIAT